METRIVQGSFQYNKVHYRWLMILDIHHDDKETVEASLWNTSYRLSSSAIYQVFIDSGFKKNERR